MMFDYLIGVVITLIIFVIWFLVAWTILREQKIIVYRKYGGKKIITGTLGEEDNMGEIVELEVRRIVPYILLTEGEKKAINQLIEKEDDYIKQLDSKDLRFMLADKRKFEEDKRNEEDDE